jgi:hypothetical protein
MIECLNFSIICKLEAGITADKGFCVELMKKEYELYIPHQIK